ncbi:hypothetical protein A9Q87_07055 [Flavobacteriales bacterium 34_180_T64]|nr:hypothetical protein A9Q87_07055 [Flavobacteriales bacterium 34_180_T64]
MACIQLSFAQNYNSGQDVISAYEDYVEMDRELAYVHLNKSTFIKGESIGLKVYILDKNTKQFSTETSNLYISISDSDDFVIKNKLVIVENGIAISDFELDDAFSSGNYTIKAYTNWMKNFEEQNFFVESIRIIDPEVEISNEIPEENDINIQFLAEGGHLLSDVNNTVGVVIKNSFGLGLPLIEGEIVDAANETITTFKVNHLGVGRFNLNPEPNKTYAAKFIYDSKEHVVAIKNVESKGIAMSVLDLKGKLGITFKTNASTLLNIKGQAYKLVIHNGNSIKETYFKFNDKTEVIQVIPVGDLFSGINIFTVLDRNNNPILERQFFNYAGFKFETSDAPVVTTANDSIRIILPYKNIQATSLNNFSVSVLPSQTRTNTHHHNLASYTLLQPYVKGYIEQAQYYFAEVTPKKKFDLDNLLLTQGWSSYDWDTIFQNPPSYDYDFENGITFTMNAVGNDHKQLLLYPNLNHSSKLVSFDHYNRSFTMSGLFPVNDEQIQVGEISSQGHVSKPNLNLRFEPIGIPSIETLFKPLRNDVSDYNLQEIGSNNILHWKKIEALDEVVLTKKKAYSRIEKLQNRSIGKVEEIDEVLIKRYRTFVRYLRDKGYTVYDTPGKFEIYNNLSNSIRSRTVDVISTVNGDQVVNNSQHSSLRKPSDDDHVTSYQDSGTVPVVYLDGMLLGQDLTILGSLTLDNIDYIEVNKFGIGGGMKAGGAGLIRIKTKPNYQVSHSGKPSAIAKYDIPLKFSVAKTFYIPNYASKTSDFFNEYGIIDWFPIIQLNENGEIEIKILSEALTEIKLFVEGMTNDQVFVSEVKTIKIK